MQNNNKIIIPENYKDIRQDYDSVETTIRNGGIPLPSNVARIFEKDALPEFYFMFALTHYKEYRSGKRIVQYERKDETPPQLHSLDCATKADYRFADYSAPPGPSLYRLIPLQKKVGLIHDNGELDDIIYSFVINHNNGRLFGEDVRKYADLLANKSELLTKPVEDRIKRLPIIDHKSVYRLLDKKLEEFEKGTNLEDRMIESIDQRYELVINALKSFGGYVNRSDMPAEKDDLLGILFGMRDFVVRLKNERLLEPALVADLIRREYMDILKVMEWGKAHEYNEVDPNLLPVTELEFEFLHTLNKTLYDRKYIKGIVEHVEREIVSAYNNGGVTNLENILTPMVVKNADSTSVVATWMPGKLETDASIFRKPRIILSQNLELGNFLAAHKLDYSLLQRSSDYLLRYMNWKIDNYLEWLQKEAKGETHFKRNVLAFGLMQQKMKGFKEKIDSMGSIDNLVQPDSRQKLLFGQVSVVNS